MWVRFQQTAIYNALPLVRRASSCPAQSPGLVRNLPIQTLAV